MTQTACIIGKWGLSNGINCYGKNQQKSSPGKDHKQVETKLVPVERTDSARLQLFCEMGYIKPDGFITGKQYPKRRDSGMAHPLCPAAVLGDSDGLPGCQP